MKNIIWINVIKNIIRCIVAYPLFLIALVISIPLNIIGWFAWIVEFVLDFFHFIFTGDFGLFKYSCIGELITDYSFCELMFVVFPITMSLPKKINNFNKTLDEIKRSQNEFDCVDMFKMLEKVKNELHNLEMKNRA